jgi:high-affinity nickel-transport protein
MANFDINRAGFIIAGLFVVVWVVALVVWRMGQVEARWEESLATTQPLEP